MDAVNTPATGERHGNNPLLLAERASVVRSRYQPLVLLLLALVAGIVFDRFGPLRLFGSAHESVGGSFWIVAWWSLSAACLAVWWLAWRKRRDALAAGLLLASASIMGAAWHHWNWYDFDRWDVSRFASLAPRPSCVLAVARSSPDRLTAPPPTPLRAIPGSERSRLLVEVTAVRDGREWRPASGVCQLTAEGHLLDIHAGDTLQVFGQLARPAPPLNPGEFDFAAFARADRQLARIRSSTPESVVLKSRGSMLSPACLLDIARTRTKQLVREMVGPKRAGLAAAILLGAREGLPFEETEPYMETGTVHVLVVSGMNVAILAAGLLGLMRVGWLPRKTGLAVIVAVVVTYALLAEAQPPVVRAAVLGVFVCWAAWTGRRGLAFNSLFGSAIIVLAINPNDLFRAGPQLSFLAVAILIWIGSWPRFRPSSDVDRLDALKAEARSLPVRALAWATRAVGLLLFISLVISLASLPLVLSQFHIASPIAILISPLIAIIVFCTMWSGFAMLLVGCLVPPVGMLFGKVCNVFLALLEGVVDWSASVPYGHFWAPGPAWWWVAVFYAGLLAVMIWGHAIAPRRWQFAALAFWILVGLVPSIARGWTRGGLENSYVSVGHGACVLMQGPHGETLLYDAGSLGPPEYATQTIASYLWERGLMRINGIVISHADIDHYNAVPGLLERFRIGAVYVSPIMFQSFGSDDPPGGLKILRDAIHRAGVPIRTIWAGDRLQVGPEVAVRVLHPPERGVIGSDNANSITLAVEYRGRRILLPGDLESPGLEDLLAERPYNCDILLAPHHGSRRSDPPGFAAWSRPEWVVISGGGGDDVQPVMQTYGRAGARVLSTNDVGTVRFAISPGGEMKFKTWLGPASY